MRLGFSWVILCEPRERGSRVGRGRGGRGGGPGKGGGRVERKAVQGWGLGVGGPAEGVTHTKNTHKKRTKKKRTEIE